jgi:hypothetical protein
LGDWTIGRLAAPQDAVSDLSLDRAFSLMLNLAGFTWSIASCESGGYRLVLLLKGQRLRPPVGNPLTLNEFSATIFSHAEDRKTAEREIKLEVLMRGCDGVEARFEPQGAQAIEFNAVVLPIPADVEALH